MNSIIISTSRKPSRRTRSLCKELQASLPHAVYLQRGKQSMNGLLQSAHELDGRLLILVRERDGNPGDLTFQKLSDDDTSPLSFKVSGVRLAREYTVERKRLSPASAVRADNHWATRKLNDLLAEFVEGIDVQQATRKVLSFTLAGDDQVRISFKESEGADESGPSITGVLES